MEATTAPPTSPPRLRPSAVLEAVVGHAKVQHTAEKDLPGGWVVQKFGGTSVGRFPVDIAENIVRLLRAAQDAKLGLSGYETAIETIRAEHIEAGNLQIKSSEILDRFKEDVNAEAKDLVKVFQSAQYLNVFTEQVTDNIVSRGEVLSALFMTAVFEDHGVPAQMIKLSTVITSEDLTTGYKDLCNAMATLIKSCGDKVPVFTGFFGSVPGGILKAIGRGYTDLCAAFVAIAAGARELQIWKEVDGIFTADPRKVPTAKLIPKVKPAEAAELTFYGSEVIHPFTMEQVMRENIPVRIKNVKNPRGKGTVIDPDKTAERSATPSSSPRIVRRLTDDSSWTVIPSQRPQRPKRPTAVTVKHNIVVMNIHSNKRVRAHGFLMKIFQTLDERNLSVDLISSSEVHVSLALHSESPMLGGFEDGDEEVQIRSRDLQLAYDDLKDYATIDLVPDMAILSLVGHELKNMVGISGRFLSVLGQNNINIEMISQATLPLTAQ